MRHGNVREASPGRSQVAATPTGGGSPQGEPVRVPGYRWMRVRALCMRDADGQPLRIAGSVSDIDARKRAEEALRPSEERYAIAMTGCAAAIGCGTSTPTRCSSPAR